MISTIVPSHESPYTTKMKGTKEILCPKVVSIAYFLLFSLSYDFRNHITTSYFTSEHKNSIRLGSVHRLPLSNAVTYVEIYSSVGFMNDVTE